MLSFGWLKDYPDFRDYSKRSEAIDKLLGKKVKPKKESSIDLRKFCSPIEDQGDLGSCTANAAAGLLEYYEKKSFNNYIDASRIFIYKTTRNLMKVKGDTGAYLRTTMKSLVHFGVAPEEYCAYNINKFDEELSPFIYSYAQNFKAIQYYRVDTNENTARENLDEIRNNLANNLALIFDFTVYNSIEEAADNGGKIPFPERGDKVAGGHAIMAAGYDDNLKIGKYQGALLIRNSWGTGWGDKGYGWLPYEYVLKGLAVDFWALIKAEYIDSSLFE